MKKKCLAMLLSVVLAVSLLPGTAFAAGTSGACGENLTWSLSNGVLTISGAGEMKNFGIYGAPWYNQRSQITTVIIENGVTSIGYYAFSSCTSLTGVTIPDGVTSIGYGAFWHCSGLTSVAIPDGVTSIGPNAFSSCSGLTSVTIPDGVTSIGDGAFWGCKGLKSVTIPDGVTSIGGSAFSGCTGLTAVTIPDSVTSIGGSAFSGCTGLTAVTINGDPSIGGNAFSDTPWLKNFGDLAIVNGILLKYQGDGGDIVIPNGVTAIAGYAFQNCAGLTGVTFPDSVTSIEKGAFWGCKGLKSVTIPGSGVSIGEEAFMSCWDLTDLTISGSMTSIGRSAFFGCTSLTDVTAGSGVSIGETAFWGCTALKRVTVSGRVASIGSRAFSGCTALTSVAAPGGVASVLSDSFSGCTALEEFIGFKRYETTRALLDGWNNPGQYVSAQSARITALANELTDGLTSDYEKARAISAWVSENIKYDWDYYYGRKSTVATAPEGVLDARLTICDGYSRLTQVLLQAAGIPARYISGAANGISGWPPGGVANHAWNMAFVDGRWIWLDTTWNSNLSSMEYFDCGTGYLVLRHNPIGNYTASADNTPSVWAQDEGWEAICKGLVPNDLQAAYRNDMTREEFCRLMVALMEKATGQSIDACLASRGLTAQEPFTDTDSADVAAAYTLGIVEGTSKTTFNPGGSISRQEAATMLARTAKVLGLTAGDSESFADKGQFASWAGESIAFISGLTDPVTGGKVMGGTGNGNFSPAASYSREQGILTALRLFHCAA